MPVKPNGTSKTWVLGALSALIGVGLLTYVLWPTIETIGRTHTLTPVSSSVMHEPKTEVLANSTMPKSNENKVLSNSNSVALEPHVEKNLAIMPEPEQTQAMAPEVKTPQTYRTGGTNQHQNTSNTETICCVVSSKYSCKTRGVYRRGTYVFGGIDV